MSEQPKPYVAYGPGFIGSYDTQEDAQALVDRWHALGVTGAVYTRVDSQPLNYFIPRGTLGYCTCAKRQHANLLSDGFFMHTRTAQCELSR
jgi:hypothetical protein